MIGIALGGLLCVAVPFGIAVVVGVFFAMRPREPWPDTFDSGGALPPSSDQGSFGAESWTDGTAPPTGTVGMGWSSRPRHHHHHHHHDRPRSSGGGFGLFNGSSSRSSSSSHKKKSSFGSSFSKPKSSFSKPSFKSSSSSGKSGGAKKKW